MGTTLENGIYLPSEGERNCYSGLAVNWQSLDSHLGNTNIHVTINDKQAWNGHIADTTIHVTSADKSKWDAVTSKADDSAVMHLTGNETSTGFKQFDNIILNNSIKAIGLDNQTVDLNNCYSTFAPSNAGNGNIQYYCCNTNGATANISNLPEKISFFLESVTFRVVTGVAHVKQTLYCYGNKTYVRYYNGSTWTSWINVHDELEPSSLSLPSGKTSDCIDISSYITALDGTNNSYTPPSNGWITISAYSCTEIYAYLNNLWGSNNARPTAGTIRVMLPVLKNIAVTICITGGGLNFARFIPCQGNI